MYVLLIVITMESNQTVPTCLHNSEAISQVCCYAGCSRPFICVSSECAHPHTLHYGGSRLVPFDLFLQKWLIARQLHAVTPLVELLDEMQRLFAKFVSEQKAKLLMWASLLKLKSMAELSKGTGRETSEVWQLIRDYSHEAQRQFASQIGAKREEFDTLLHGLTVKLPTIESASEQTVTVLEPDEGLCLTPSKAQEAERKHLFEDALRRCQSDYTLVSKLHPQTSSEYVERAKLHEKQRHEIEAIEDYSQAIAMDPKNLTAIFKRAILHTSLKNYLNAESDYSKYLQLDRSSAFVWSNRALILQALGRHKEALSDLDAALEVEPLYEHAIISRAKLLLSERRFDSSLADFNRYIQLNKKNSSAYYGRGRIQAAQGNAKEAISDFTTALGLDSNNLAALIDRANCYHSLKELSLAERDYSDAIKCSPSMGNLYYNRAVIELAAKEEDKATLDLEKCLELTADNEQAAILLSNLYMSKKRYADAEKLLAHLAQKCADQATLVNVRYNLALARRNSGHFQQAIQDYTWVIQLRPAHLHSYLGRAASYMQQHQYSQALADYTKSLELDSGNLDIIYNVGVANDSQGLTEVARDCYSKVLQREPTHVAALKARARCHFRLNDTVSYQADSKRVQTLESES